MAGDILKNFSVLDSGTNTFGLDQFKRLEISSVASDQEILEFIKSVKSENCIHSWKDVQLGRSGGYLEELIGFENKKRPTQIFFYYGIKSSTERILIAAATVALKITNDFKHEGFPVLARCYIKQDYRNLRLYFPILKHRFDYCTKVFGKKLRGIHLGSANPRVFHVIKKNMLGFPFCYLGDEYLSLGQSNNRVHDFLWLSNSFTEELLEIRNRKKDVCFSYQTLVKNIEALVENKYSSSGYHALLNSIHAIESETNWFPSQVNEGLGQLLDFMAAIPIINEQIPIEPELTSIITRAA